MISSERYHHARCPPDTDGLPFVLPSLLIPGNSPAASLRRARLASPTLSPRGPQGPDNASIRGVGEQPYAARISAIARSPLPLRFAFGISLDASSPPSRAERRVPAERCSRRGASDHFEISRHRDGLLEDLRRGGRSIAAAGGAIILRYRCNVYQRRSVCGRQKAAGRNDIRVGRFRG